MKRKETNCFRCGNPIPPTRPARHGNRRRLDGSRTVRPPRRFCSARCSHATNNDDKLEQIRAAAEWSTCLWCHDLFPPRRGHRRFCSRTCARDFHVHDMQRRIEVGRSILEGRVGSGSL